MLRADSGFWGLSNQGSEKVPDLELLMLGFMRVNIQGRKQWVWKPWGRGMSILWMKTQRRGNKESWYWGKKHKTQGIRSYMHKHHHRDVKELSSEWEMKKTLGSETSKYHKKRVKSPNYGKISNIPKDEVVESNKKYWSNWCKRWSCDHIGRYFENYLIILLKNWCGKTFCNQFTG